MLTIVGSSGVRVAVRGVQDGALAQLDGLLHAHVEVVVAEEQRRRRGEEEGEEPCV